MYSQPTQIVVLYFQPTQRVASCFQPTQSVILYFQPTQSVVLYFQPTHRVVLYFHLHKVSFCIFNIQNVSLCIFNLHKVTPLFNCELLHGCMLVAGCRLLVTKLHAGYRVTARWLPGYWPLVYGSTVGCLLRVTEQQILTCMHAFCIHGPSLYSCGSVALGQPGRLCSSAVHQFRPHSRI